MTDDSSNMRLSQFWTPMGGQFCAPIDTLPLASVEELEAIGDELGKLFDNRKKNDRPCLARCGRTVSMTFSKLAYLDLKNGFIASFATFSTSF
jgi:hypothetical protein